MNTPSPALPWGLGATATPTDPLRDAAANMALLGAAKALEKAGRAAEGASAEEVVAQALLAMSEQERQAAAAMLKRTEERVYGVIQRLRAQGGDVTGEHVLLAFQDEVRN